MTLFKISLVPQALTERKFSPHAQVQFLVPERRSLGTRLIQNFNVETELGTRPIQNFNVETELGTRLGMNFA